MIMDLKKNRKWLILILILFVVLVIIFYFIKYTQLPKDSQVTNSSLTDIATTPNIPAEDSSIEASPETDLSVLQRESEIIDQGIQERLEELQNNKIPITPELQIQIQQDLQEYPTQLDPEISDPIIEEDLIEEELDPALQDTQ